MRSITDGADSPTCSPILASGSLAVLLQQGEDLQVDLVEIGLFFA